MKPAASATPSPTSTHACAAAIAPAAVSPNLPAAPLPADAVEVGRIAEAWGVRGGFKVHAFSADPQALFTARQWWLQPPEQGMRTFAGTVVLPVRQVRAQGAGIVAASSAITDRDMAQALRGARIFIAREHFPQTEDGEYYWVDLIGLTVRNREGVCLGTVHNLLSTAAQTVLVLHDHSTGGPPRERMIPFVNAYIDSVDLPSKTIVADWQPDY